MVRMLYALATLAQLILIGILGNMATATLQNAITTELIRDLSVALTWLLLAIAAIITMWRTPWTTILDRLVPPAQETIKDAFGQRATTDTTDSAIEAHADASTSANVRIIDYGQLHASLSALRSNAESIQKLLATIEIEGNNNSGDIAALYVVSARVTEWGDSIRRVLESFDQGHKSEIFGAGDVNAILNGMNQNDLSLRKKSTEDWLNDHLGRLSGIMAELPA